MRLLAEKAQASHIYACECTPGRLGCKACLFGIDRYLADSGAGAEIQRQLRENAWDCGNCNEKCRGGVAFSIDGQPYKKCIGGAFTFGGLEHSDWYKVAELIERELT